MAANAPRKRTAQKVIFVGLILLICVVAGYSIYEENKPWVVPEEFKRLRSPYSASEASLRAARGIYHEECAQCHGETGKGDGPEARTHSPAPADLTDAGRMSGVTDGEIFYQITAGRRPMPSFKSRLTEEQRWQLTLLVRSFSQKTAESRKQSEESSEKQTPH